MKSANCLTLTTDEHAAVCAFVASSGNLDRAAEICNDPRSDVEGWLEAARLKLRIDEGADWQIYRVRWALPEPPKVGQLSAGVRPNHARGLQEIVKGGTSRDAAAAAGVQPQTWKNYVGRLCSRKGINSRSIFYIWWTAQLPSQEAATA